jgi:hypothetical protein
MLLNDEPAPAALSARARDGGHGLRRLREVALRAVGLERPWLCLFALTATRTARRVWQALF